MAISNSYLILYVPAKFFYKSIENCHIQCITNKAIKKEFQDIHRQNYNMIYYLYNEYSPL